MRYRPSIVCVCSLALLWLALTGHARAQATVKGEVLVILAREAEGEIDPRLERIPALRKPPFSAFKSMQVLSTVDVELDGQRAATVALPNKRTLQLKLVERMGDGRHKVQVSIKSPGKDDYLPLLTVVASGEPFFVAGQSYKGGTLVIGVRIGAKQKENAKQGEK